MGKLEIRQEAVEKATFEKRFWRKLAEKFLTEEEKELYYELLSKDLKKNGFEDIRNK